MPHIEILQTASSTSAPGWAYVLDNAVDPSKIPIDPTTNSRKKGGRVQRAATSTTVTNNELSRRETIAIQRRLADLDKDGGSGKDVPIPAKWKDFAVGTEGNGVGTWGKGRKMTSGVRKVLFSEKNFGHWLDDEEARLALTRDTATGALQGRRSDFGVKRNEKRSSTGAKVKDEDDEMVDVMEQDAESDSADSSKQNEDADAKNPIFRISVPSELSSSELDDLLSQPPLSYNAARAKPPGPGEPPQRRFCEMCGYWGRVMCLKCGSRVCGLTCKEAHDMDCRRRFA